MSDKLQVWSCGGGTQSCAIAALIVQGKLTKPDFAVISDTGREVQATWNYVNRILIPELSNVGVWLEIIKADELGYNKTDLFTWNGGELLIPAFTTSNGKGKLRNFCTKWWKYDIIKRWLAYRGVTNSRTVRWIGFSRDEQRRIVAMQQGEDFKEGRIRFPLLEVGFARRESIRFVLDMGWPMPPRSRCWMCPNQGDHEWRQLKEESPEEFDKAVALEKMIQERDPDAWLHRSCVPLDQVDFSQPEDLFSRPCDSGMCFV